LTRTRSLPDRRRQEERRRKEEGKANFNLGGVNVNDLPDERLWRPPGLPDGIFADPKFPNLVHF
jgi:hypothetical protein